MTHAGSPAEQHVPAEWRSKILHARLVVGDAVLLASDAPPGHYHKPQGFSVSIQIKDTVRGEGIFRALADGGTVTMPFEETFWAARFGMLVDKFGIPWMVNCDQRPRCPRPDDAAAQVLRVSSRRGRGKMIPLGAGLRPLRGYSWPVGYVQFESVPEILREPLALWWERVAAQDGFLSAYAGLFRKALRAELPRVAAGSEFVASALIQDPRALEWFGRHEEPSAARDAGADYEARAAAAPTTADAQRTLREWRRREMLRIAWRDIAGRAGVLETLHALSDFADAAIRAAASAAQLHLQAVFGRAARFARPRRCRR